MTQEQGAQLLADLQCLREDLASRYYGGPRPWTEPERMMARRITLLLGAVGLLDDDDDDPNHTAEGGR